MLVSMDRAGRVVIPKEARDALGLDAGADLELVVDSGGIRLSPAPRPERRVVMSASGLPVLEAVEGWVLTDLDVQRLRDADRR
jgi:AbrB family looped-hinge helix DNA binding protein